MRLTIVNLFLGAWRGRFGRHPCTKAPAIEPAMCGASIAADGGYMSLWRRGGKVSPHSRCHPGLVRNCALGRDDELNRHLPMQHRRAGGEAFGRIDDGVGVDAVVAVEVGDGASLAELLDAERLDAVATDAAEPAQRRRMAIDHGHDAALARQRREQLFDVAEMLNAAPITAQFPCGGPPRMQTIRGRDR